MRTTKPGPLRNTPTASPRPQNLPIFRFRAVSVDHQFEYAKALGLAVPPTLLALADEVEGWRGRHRSSIGTNRLEQPTQRGAAS
jgi:hypothetical protein